MGKHDETLVTPAGGAGDGEEYFIHILRVAPARHHRYAFVRVERGES
jgi:hypothetical protein